MTPHLKTVSGAGTGHGADAAPDSFLRPQNDHDSAPGKPLGLGLGSLIPSRAPKAIAPISAFSDGNVVPFHAPLKKAGAALALALGAEARAIVAPLPEHRRKGWRAGMSLLSVALHIALVMTFAWASRDLPSLDVQVISAELVPGAMTKAGRSHAPSEQEIDSSSSAAQADMAQQSTPKETQADANSAETKRETSRTAPASLEMNAPAPSSQDAPDDLQANASPAAEFAPAPPARPEQPAQQPRGAVSPKMHTPKSAQSDNAKPKPSAKRTLRPRKEATRAREETRASQAQSASRSSNGAGIGRSSSRANYSGLVAAHLARFKSYSEQARAAGASGTAQVSIAVAPSGSVTAARLARSSGHAMLDRDALAIVRRASPLPAPPDGRAVQLQAPIRFGLR